MAVTSPLPEPDKGGFLNTIRNVANSLLNVPRKVQGFFGQDESVPDPVQQAPRVTYSPQAAQQVRGVQPEQIDTPNVNTSYAPSDYQQAIQQGYANWGSPPAANYAQAFAAEIQKYPIFQKYPFLLPAIALLETSGGKNVTYQNNLLNWGIGPQSQGIFNPQSYEEVIGKAASGIGQRTSYYEQFRNSGNLSDLANVYAPMSDNPGSGGEIYAKRLQEVMDIFEQAMTEIKNKKK